MTDDIATISFKEWLRLKSERDQAVQLLRDWLKRSEAFPEMNEFRGNYRPFLNKNTITFLDSLDHLRK